MSIVKNVNGQFLMHGQKNIMSS